MDFSALKINSTGAGVPTLSCCKSSWPRSSVACGASRCTLRCTKICGPGMRHHSSIYTRIHHMDQLLPGLEEWMVDSWVDDDQNDPKWPAPEKKKDPQPPARPVSLNHPILELQRNLPRRFGDPPGRCSDVTESKSRNLTQMLNQCLITVCTVYVYIRNMLISHC